MDKNVQFKKIYILDLSQALCSVIMLFFFFNLYFWFSVIMLKSDK